MASNDEATAQNSKPLVNSLKDDVLGNDDAVGIASEKASPGDVVLLSPACASFDMYKNFEHRGQAFIESVKNLS